jgi:hypothetical protein
MSRNCCALLVLRDVRSVCTYAVFMRPINVAVSCCTANYWHSLVARAVSWDTASINYVHTCLSVVRSFYVMQWKLIHLLQQLHSYFILTCNTTLNFTIHSLRMHHLVSCTRGHICRRLQCFVKESVFVQAVWLLLAHAFVCTCSVHIAV